jgi:heptosyltransferase-3
VNARSSVGASVPRRRDKEFAFRAAVFRPGALGDLILTAPVLNALVEACTDRGARLDLHLFATMPHGKALASGDAAWGRLTVHDFGDRRCAWLFGAEGPAPDGLDDVLRDADAAIAYLADDDGIFRARLESLGIRKVVIHPARPHAGRGGDRETAAKTGRLHIAEHLWAALSELGPPAEKCAWPPDPPPIPTPESPALRLKGSELRAGMERLAPMFPRPPEGGLAAIHPGSGGKTKCAPPEIFAELARLAEDAGMSPFLICGPADAEAVRATNDRLTAAGLIRRTTHGGAAPDSGSPSPSLHRNRSGLPTLIEPPLRELAAILSACEFYAGNDSGVTHLAAAMGAPVLAFFGPTDPAVWAPRGQTVRIIRFEDDGTGIRLTAPPEAQAETGCTDADRTAADFFREAIIEWAESRRNST